MGYTNNMVSLKLVVCVCVLFTIGIEAAPEPKPWCIPPRCSGGVGSSGTIRGIFYNRGLPVYEDYEEFEDGEDYEDYEDYEDHEDYEDYEDDEDDEDYTYII